MSSQVWTFTTSQTFHFTGSSLGRAHDGGVTASIACWGSGGDGNVNGVGGSGGAYAAKLIVLKKGSYEVVVGTRGTASRFGNSVIAAGGKQDGAVDHQITMSTGSVVFPGGRGGNSNNSNGGGGGGAGGRCGPGEDGLAGCSATEYGGAKGGKYNNVGVERYGGSGAYYYAGAGANQIVRAGGGDLPGCGGGGGYQSSGLETAGGGGAGLVQIYIDSAFS